MRKANETNLHIAIANYIKLQYPNVIFTSESSGIRLSIGQATQLKRMRSSAGLPDLWLLEPRKGYHACLLELKKEGTTIYKKNGELRKDKHLEEQEKILSKLQEKGYFAKFVVGFNDAKAVVDFYLG
jgi:hypothetical protein